MTPISTVVSTLCAFSLLATMYQHLKFRFLRRLRHHESYSGTSPANAADIHFITAPTKDADLQELCETYGLQTIAGDGTDEERVSPKGNVHVYTNNPDLFWQSPMVDQDMSRMMEATINNRS